MRSKILFWAAIFALILGVSSSFSLEAKASAIEDGPPKILVGLAENRFFSLAPPENTLLLFPSGREVAVDGGSDIEFSLFGAEIFWEVKKGGNQEISGIDEGAIVLKGNGCSQLEAHLADGTVPSFFGDLLIMVKGGSLFLANAVDLESYVSSVVSKEMPSLWPKEALKAQAIASRTYALYKCGGLDGLFKDLDLLSVGPGSVKILAEDQAYLGARVLTEAASLATSSTKGEVMVYDEKAIAAFYCADAGGVTEDSLYVWGGEKPYLKPVFEVPYLSPYSSWSIFFTAAELARVLEIPGETCLEVLGGNLSESGRWSNFLVRTQNQRLSFRGNDFRLRTGLQSLLFSMYKKGGGGETAGYLSPNLDICVQSLSEKSYIKGGAAFVQGKSGVSAPGGPLTALSTLDEGPLTYIFIGSGWGHGVGLSQWGAKAMAEGGAKAEDILLHYFDGACIETWY